MRGQVCNLSSIEEGEGGVAKTESEVKIIANLQRIVVAQKVSCLADTTFTGVPLGFPRELSETTYTSPREKSIP